MANIPKQPVPTVEAVDKLIGETSDDTPIDVVGEHEITLGASGPTNWWLYGVVGLAIVIALLLVLQMFNGAPGSDVQPASPTAAPVVEPVVPQ